MEVENCETKSELKLFLSEAYPGIEKISFAISVNRIINPANELLTDGDEVALLPPFSGG
ncbi:MAG: MoaD/ThiS family protein [Bacteroidetes bacterium]|nr:MoaD/ThiS family protein [Bacteroidota bacterium]